MRNLMLCVLVSTLLSATPVFGESMHQQQGLKIVQDAQVVMPRRAQARGISGYVIVEYTVTARGAVQAPVVIEAKPPAIFDRAAINGVLKVRYDNPGREVPGVRMRVRFEGANPVMEPL